MTYKSFLISFLIAAALAMVAGGATAQMMKPRTVAPGAVLKTPTLGPKVTVAPVQSETPRPGAGITVEHPSKPGTSALTGGGRDVPAAKRGGGEEASPSPLEKGSKPPQIDECCN